MAEKKKTLEVTDQELKMLHAACEHIRLHRPTRAGNLYVRDSILKEDVQCDVYDLGSLIGRIEELLFNL